MRALAGVTNGGTTSREEVGSVLDKLRRAKDEEALTKIWKTTQRKYSSEPRGLRLFRMQLLEVLLEQTAKSTEPNLDKAHEIIRLIDDPVSPRPAEAHYLVMLRKDLPKDNRVGAATLGDSLETRLEAERAALGLPSDFPLIPPTTGYYCEHIVPWIIQLVAEADRERLLGQDLMFADDEAHWNKGRDHLRLARNQLYRRASETGQRLREAFAIRDQVLADAPYMARWIASRCVAIPEEGKAMEPHLRDGFVKLLRETHRLHALLAPPTKTIQAKTLQAKVDEISTLAKSIRKSYDDLREHFTKFRNRIEQADKASAWRDMNDALAMPFDNPKVRLEFLAKRSRIGKRLQVRTEAANDADFEVTAKENQKLAKDHGYCQGLMALEILGKSWFDNTPRPAVRRDGAARATQTHEQVQHQLINFRVEQRWWDTLGWAGEEIGVRWRQIPVAVNNFQKLKQTSTLAEAETSLRQADYLSR